MVDIGEPRVIPELQELVETFEELERLSAKVHAIVGALSARILAAEEAARELRVRVDALTWQQESREE